MKKIKTIGLSLGAVMVLATPAIVMVSCGNDEKPFTISKKEEDVIINVADLSVADTVDQIVKAIKVNMDQLGDNEDAWTLAKDVAKIKTYMKQIDVNKSVFLQNGNSAYELDFRPVKQWVDKIVAATELTNNPNPSGMLIGAGLQTYGMPEIAVYVGEAMGLAKSMEMGAFMRLSTDVYTEATKTQFFDNHGYIQMLNEYHRIIWEFVQSDFYSQWIDGKTFDIIENKGTSIVQYVPGEAYDNPSGIDWSLPPKQHDGEIQSSNFEVVFGLRLLNAYRGI